jgi:hypothetical protein
MNIYTVDIFQKKRGSFNSFLYFCRLEHKFYYKKYER